MFNFYEIVRVLSCPKYPAIVGKEGYVAGMSYEDGGPIEGYGIYMFEEEKVYSLDAHEIVSLGCFFDPEKESIGDH